MILFFRPSFGSIATLLLIVALVLLRMVGLHWHQHLQPPCPTEACAAVTVQYIADAATPHLAEDQDFDMPLVGEALTLAGLSIMELPTAILLLLPLLPLLSLLASVSLLRGPDVFPVPRPGRIAPSPPRRTLRPPLRAPPATIS